ncbi:Protein MCM10 [Orchesella cincta]|uniref:Protein MCM10 homolog n=1 Tax=Orchesella cincta TaxID=48709 RepID=A0A1D2NC17_ORCCI|nr:Protein MCM10 [Orchesella cincta]
MEELLGFMEEDLQYDDEPDDDPRAPDPSCSRISLSPLKSHNSSSTLSQSKNKELTFKDVFGSPDKRNTKGKKELTFTDVFGSPDKRDVKEFGLSSNSSSTAKKTLNLGASPVTTLSSRFSDSTLAKTTPSSSNGRGSDHFELSKAINRDNNVPYKVNAGLVMVDPFSRVRIVKSTISIFYDETVSAEAVLKERNIGMEFVSLQTFSSWYRGKGKDCKNFWVSGVLTKKTAGVRKSAKGNDYSIWELNDLKDLDKKYTVFLFGSSSGSSTLTGLPAGSLIDITTPSVMQDASSGTIKFSINNATQVRFIASANDFGYCQSKKKDGNKCTNVVNTWECSFCVHHASSELKKLNFGSGSGKKGKAAAKNGFVPNKSFSGGGESQQSLKQQGIVIADFGRTPPGTSSMYETNKSFGGKTATTARPTYSSRMSLQGGSNEMKKNPLKFGNPDTVTFVKNGGDHPLLKKEPVPVPVRKPLDLNPTKTRHLTDKDRELLQMLDCKPETETPSYVVEFPDSQSPEKKSTKPKAAPASAAVNDLITTSIVNNPNAASRNFMQFLMLQNAPKDQVDLTSAHKSSKLETLTMSRAKVTSMQKALAFVKQNGPLSKADPNAVANKKRKLGRDGASPSSQQSGPSKKRSNTKATDIEVEFDFDSDDFKKILNAKSAHDDELDAIQHEEYFGKLEKKEALENKLLTTFSIETNAVMCRQCKYVALSQSEFCKEQLHEVRLVKARKRFFKCKDCGNRTMSLDRLPKRPCSNCNSSSWLVAPVGKERKGPTLPSEVLSIRGNEEKFVGSAGSKNFLHLEV